MASRGRWQRSTVPFAASDNAPCFMKRHHLQSSITRARLLSGLAVLLALPCWPVFAASLVYIKDGNVWIATPDGTTKRQVTTDGTPDAPYYSPSQADDGTIFAGGASKKEIPSMWQRQCDRKRRRNVRRPGRGDQYASSLRRPGVRAGRSRRRSG